MEANREEAIRVKVLAQNSMEKKDFVSALGLAVKAQQLYPGLEHISTIIMVCEVICSGSKMVNDTENDWYAILKVEATDDDATIKKQYRKFALHLHPDKNKFTGASDAFNLILQAQTVLLDRSMRLQYDLRLQAARSKVRRVNHQSYTQSHVKRQPPYQNSGISKFASKTNKQQQQHNQSANDGSTNNKQQQQQHNQSANDGSTFWTKCPHCLSLFMYYKQILGKNVACRNCNMSFTALENKSFSTSPASSTKPSSMQKEEAGIDLPKQASQSGLKYSYSKVELKKDVSDIKKSEPRNGITSVATDTSKPKREYSNVESTLSHPPDIGMSGSRILNKRKLMVPQNSHSKMEFQKDSDEKSSRVEHGVNPTSGLEFDPKDGDSNVESTVQESIHLSESNNIINKKRKMEKRDSTYEEKQISGNGDHVIQNKSDSSNVESVKNNKAGLCMNTEENQVKIKGRERSSAKEIAKHGEKDVEKEFHTYLDSEFSNFDDLRAKSILKKGQIWAVYDSLDAMPRFYAIITKVSSPDFVVELTWLEPDPDHEEEIKWIEEGLPVSCGKFRRGHSDIIEDIRMLSHPVYFEKSSGECTYDVHPRRGETWALFKDWDINWYACSETKKKYAYEFVEVLSEYSRAEGVHVAFLTKLEGFSCIFNREKKGACSVLIPAKERFRFSHKVPSFKMAATESTKLVTGSFELDPASLPTHEDGTVFLEVSNSVDKEMHNPSVDQAVNGKAESQGFAVQENMESMRKVGIHVGGFDKVEGKPKIGSSLQGLVGISAESIENQNHLSKLRSDMETELLKSKSACNSTSTKDATQTKSKLQSDMETKLSKSKFYNFAQDKFPSKFQIGQIWAIYRNGSSAPKHYGMIKNIDPFPAFRLHVTWFHACSAPRQISLVSKGSPIGCGKFKLKPGRPAQFTNTDVFSHQVKAEVMESSERNAVYAIFPKKGEIWAMYRDSKHALNDYTCQIVEVKEENDTFLTVSILEQFQRQPQVIMKPNGAVQIHKTELFRFSHQVPARRLTEEGGFWELDAAALTNYFLHP